MKMLRNLDTGASAWTEFEREAERCRRGFAALIGAEFEQVALIPNASTGAYQIISTLALGARDGVVTSADEFPSVAHVWLAQRHRGARVRFVDSPDAYGAAIDERTALVSVPLVTYALGARLPVVEIARTAHAHGAPIFVDAYQAVGVLPVDVNELECDYLVAGTQKYLLGLPGLAFLYVRDSAGTELEPVLTGLFGRTDPFRFDARRLDFPPTARRFETGTPAVPALYAANAGLHLLAETDPDEVASHVAGLTALAAERLTKCGEFVQSAAAEQRGAHIALNDRDPQGLAEWLDERDIRVSPRGSLLRLAFHYYNSADDVKAVCDAIDRYRRR
jgi:selenocysteine lyase/cysteine desulfurase